MLDVFGECMRFSLSDSDVTRSRGWPLSKSIITPSYLNHCYYVLFGSDKRLNVNFRLLPTEYAYISMWIGHCNTIFIIFPYTNRSAENIKFHSLSLPALQTHQFRGEVLQFGIPDSCLVSWLMSLLHLRQGLPCLFSYYRYCSPFADPPSVAYCAGFYPRSNGRFFLSRKRLRFRNFHWKPFPLIALDIGEPKSTSTWC